MAFLKKIKFGDSSNNIAKTIVNGAPGGVISVTNTAEHTNLDSEDKDYSYDIDVNVDNATIVKSSGSLAVGTVPAAKVSVADSDGVFTAENVETALKELKDDIAKVDGAAKSYTIIEKTESLPTNVAHRYKLQQTIGEGATAQVSEVGENIDILKDNSLLAAKLSTTDATWDGSAIVDGKGDEALVLVYKDAEGTAQVIAIDVSAFLKESEFGDGLQVTNGVVSAKLGNGIEFGNEATGNKSLNVKIDSASETFLSVGADGIKLAGVQNAIDAAIAALDSTDNAVAGKVVTAVSTANGIATPTKADLAGIELGGFTEDATATGDIAATDTLGAALNKLQNKIDAAADDHTVVEHAQANTHVTVSGAANANGGMTYTVTETDIASAQGLANEITRAQSAETAIDSAIGLTKAESGEGRTYANTGEYIGKAQTNTVASDIAALDTQVKENANDIATLETKVGAIEYEVKGTELIFYGIPQHSSQSPEPEPEP